MKKIIFSFVTVGFLSLFCIVGSADATTETYTVKPGDSLWKVSINHNLTVDQLKKMNNLTSDTIFVGQQLTVSNPTSNQPKYNIIFQAGKKVKIPILAAPSLVPENQPDKKPSNPLSSSSEEILLAVVVKIDPTP